MGRRKSRKLRTRRKQVSTRRWWVGALLTVAVLGLWHYAHQTSLPSESIREPDRQPVGYQTGEVSKAKAADFAETVIKPSLLWAWKEDSIPWVRQIIDQVLRKSTAKDLVFERGLIYNPASRDALGSNYFDKDGGWVIVYYIPRLIDWTERLNQSEAGDVIIKTTVHEFLHLRDDSNRGKGKLSNEEETVSESVVWGTQIKQMLLPMREQHRFLAPFEEEAIAAFIRSGSETNSLLWRRWIKHKLINKDE
ncbi:hypothetical protein HYZ64_03125 [Candidatus Berkelbacteria bacterium]|nr:hypothetical protein [Candidatus Berkelbacteria bacterium]